MANGGDVGAFFILELHQLCGGPVIIHLAGQVNVATLIIVFIAFASSEEHHVKRCRKGWHRFIVNRIDTVGKSLGLAPLSFGIAGSEEYVLKTLAGALIDLQTLCPLPRRAEINGFKIPVCLSR